MANNDSSTVVISSELFYTEIRNETQCEAIKIFLDNYFTDIKVIAYLCPQEKWINSRISQTAKLGGVSSIEDILDAKVNNYFLFLEKWRKIFGKSNIILKTLEPSRLFEKDLFSDFLKIIGTEKTPDLIIPERKNEGLSIETVLFLQKFNHLVPFFREHQIRNLERTGITEMMEAYSKDKSKNLLPEKHIALIRKKYAESNEELRRLYFPRRKNSFFGKQESGSSKG